LAVFSLKVSIRYQLYIHADTKRRISLPLPVPPQKSGGISGRYLLGWRAGFLPQTDTLATRTCEFLSAQKEFPPRKGHLRPSQIADFPPRTIVRPEHIDSLLAFPRGPVRPPLRVTTRASSTAALVFFLPFLLSTYLETSERNPRLVSAGGIAFYLRRSFPSPPVFLHDRALVSFVLRLVSGIDVEVWALWKKGVCRLTNYQSLRAPCAQSLITMTRSAFGFGIGP